MCSLQLLSLELGKKKEREREKGEKETLCKGLLLSMRYTDSIFSTFVALGLQ